MTPEEHQLQILMFARLYEAIEILKETFKSRGLWTDDDEMAFSVAVHADVRVTVKTTMQAYSDYTRIARNLGVATGLDAPPAPPPAKGSG